MLDLACLVVEDSSKFVTVRKRRRRRRRRFVAHGGAYGKNLGNGTVLTFLNGSEVAATELSIISVASTELSVISTDKEWMLPPPHLETWPISVGLFEICPQVHSPQTK